jgi:uncharacterized protein YqhQ
VAEAARPAKPPTTDHLYGGQAVVEGVMMRGADHWAVAVRQPSGEIYLESHPIDSVAERHPVWRRPFLRGMLVLGQSLAIGARALLVAANHTVEEEDQLTSRQLGFSLAIAMVVFVAIFILGPTAGFVWLESRLSIDGVLVNVLEGLARVLLFVGYLWLIGRTKDIRRVFEYHGAEHKTIAAYEHGDELTPERISTYPKEHVRCGTNFLIIVMIITIFVFTLFGTPGLLWRLLSRVVAIPVIAGLAYEALRMGARFPDSAVMRALMAPGIWLQKITTRPCDDGQIAVATASFREVLRLEAEAEAEAAGTT